MTDTMLDAIDTAFVNRWRQATTTPAREATIAAAMPETLATQASPPPLAPEPQPDCPIRPEGDASLVQRLLEAAWPEWNGLAAHVEAARLRGRRVFAVAGGEPREGRTTLVACLAAVLRARGRDVSCTTSRAPAAAAAPDTGLSHDKRIVLVDAGIWFPPGPIRRQWLAHCTLGSDAAVLVRRAGRGPVAARQAVLESLGIEVLGEVLTFTDDVPASDAGTCP